MAVDIFEADDVASYTEHINTLFAEKYNVETSKEQDFAVFFRGQNQSFLNENETEDNLLEKLQPSIYRNPALINNEDKIFRDSILSNPDDFTTEQSTMEKLVKMQHYQMPTRVLDLTANALMGLYFACEESADQRFNRMNTAKFRNAPQPDAGYVYVFKIEREGVKYFDSDTVSVIANITRRPWDKDNDGLEFKELYVQAAEAIKDTMKKPENLKFSVDEELVNKAFGLSNDGKKTVEYIPQPIAALISCLKDNPRVEQIKNIVIEASNNCVIILKLLHEIQNEKPYFKPKIKFDHLFQVLCVRSLMKNRRIIRQDGAFFLFGMTWASANGNKNYPHVPLDWVRAIIKIPHKCKEPILVSLEKLGVSKDKVYPEMDKVAEYLKEHYQKKNAEKGK